MNPKRPFAVTLICVIMILVALIDCVSGLMKFWNSTDPIFARWAQEHPRPVTLQIIAIYTHAALTLLACYFMLRAKTWARGLFVLWGAVRHITSFVVLALPADPEGFDFLRFRGALVPELLFFILALIILFRPAANEYFAAGGRPWWKNEEE